MDRDIGYDEAITPDPRPGGVILLGEDDGTNPGGMLCDGLGTRDFNPLDGPIHLEAWGVSRAASFDAEGTLGDASTRLMQDPCLIGRLPTGELCMTGPVTECVQFGPLPLAFVADGLCFELGAPSEEWLNASDDPSGAVEKFMAEYKPLSTDGWQSGVMN